MIVTIHDSVFLPENADDILLLEIFRLSFDGRHIVFVDGQDAFAVWLGKQSQECQTTCQMAIDNSFLQHATSFPQTLLEIHVGDDEFSDRKLNLQTANEVLKSPIEVWFENDINDSAFLLSTVKEEFAQMLSEYESKRWVQFRNAGGIGSMVQRAKRLTAKEAISSFFLFVSAARYASTLSLQAQAVQQACDDVPVLRRCLTRRAIENYIPTRTLKAWAYQPSFRGQDGNQRRLRVDALSRLNPVQKSVFNMKKGFNGDVPGNGERPWNALATEIAELYSDVDLHDRQLLEDGIQANVASQIFHTMKIPYGWLVEDGANIEMDETVLEILGLA